MTSESEKKSIFDKAVDALTARDEEAELEETQQQLAELQKKLKASQQAAAQAQAEAAKKQKHSQKVEQRTEQDQKAIKQANKRAEEAEARVQKLELQLRGLIEAEEARRQSIQAEKATKAEAASQVITEHTMKSDETLSHLALHYYGHATKPYWMVIYEANKEAIGDNPNRVRVGTLLKIPDLPEELKDK